MKARSTPLQESVAGSRRGDAAEGKGVRRLTAAATPLNPFGVAALHDGFPRDNGSRRNPVLTVVLLLLSLGFLTGCESTDGGSSNASGNFYYGVGVYDPWYYGGYHDDPDIIVTPPSDGSGGAHPSHPIARPPSVSAPRPTPMPSIPARPMPRAR